VVDVHGTVTAVMVLGVMLHGIVYHSKLMWSKMHMLFYLAYGFKYQFPVLVVQLIQALLPHHGVVDLNLVIRAGTYDLYLRVSNVGPKIQACFKSLCVHF
jgi:hypothetical protein